MFCLLNSAVPLHRSHCNNQTRADLLPWSYRSNRSFPSLRGGSPFFPVWRIAFRVVSQTLWECCCSGVSNLVTQGVTSFIYVCRCSLNNEAYKNSAYRANAWQVYLSTSCICIKNNYFFILYFSEKEKSKSQLWEKCWFCSDSQSYKPDSAGSG